jgi:23S rRNA (adenine2503-C2)-methyltransferase
MSEKLCGMTNDELFHIICVNGFDKNHSAKVLSAVYRKRMSDILQISGIPKKLKELLISDFVSGIYPPADSEKSIDKTVKFLFRNSEDLTFESVYLLDNKRNTVCVSSQAGCRMGCPFCVTGRYGFKGNLSSGDMINQVISLQKAEPVSHVVFMGMGEPMDNIEEVIKACQILTSDWGLSISSRNITVSTVGLLPGIMEFLEKSHCNLALSLLSPFPEERQLLVPAEKKYPSHKIIEILKSYPLVKKRRFSIAYVMIKNVNDSDSHLSALKELLTGSSIRVNILPYHRGNDDINQSSADERMHFFKHELVTSGISASVRKSRGEDISAACGLLASGMSKN